MQLFLLKDSPRRLDLSIPNYQQLLDHLVSVKNKDYVGYYRINRSSTGFLGSLVGSTGSEYYEYCTQEILRPDAFDEVEWACFMHLFHAIEGSRKDDNDGVAIDDDVVGAVDGRVGDGVEDEHSFYNSEVYIKYKNAIDIESAQRKDESLRLYEQHRKMKIGVWTRHFMELEKAMASKALEAVLLFLDREVPRYYKIVEKEQVHARMEEKRHAEQSRYEFECAFVDDIVFHAESDILDGLAASVPCP